MRLACEYLQTLWPKAGMEVETEFRIVRYQPLPGEEYSYELPQRERACRRAIILRSCWTGLSMGIPFLSDPSKPESNEPKRMYWAIYPPAPSRA